MFIEICFKLYSFGGTFGELWEIISAKYTMTAVYPRNILILQYSEKAKAAKLKILVTSAIPINLDKILIAAAPKRYQK